ncbi:MAG TPA: disulfide bond formation protein B [Acidimicrobiales bacterium]|jgi:disulfide bond formation protein DsbB|nr:disulfide bond formation protein B [Acidimicrobiales bacterium]
MSRDAVILFLSLLAVGAQAAVLVIVVCAVSGRHVAAARRVLLDEIGPHVTLLAFIVAAVAMSGSLYFSEVAHFTPCVLCWYQRAAMYPLVPILGLAVLLRRDDVWPYALALSIIGAMISTYHVLLERYPNLETGACDPTNPCTLIWTRRFGYLTIPTMALTAFVLIGTLIGTGFAAERRWRDAAPADPVGAGTER